MCVQWRGGWVGAAEEVMVSNTCNISDNSFDVL